MSLVICLSLSDAHTGSPSPPPPRLLRILTVASVGFQRLCWWNEACPWGATSVRGYERTEQGCIKQLKRNNTLQENKSGPRRGLQPSRGWIMTAFLKKLKSLNCRQGWDFPTGNFGFGGTAWRSTQIFSRLPWSPYSRLSYSIPFFSALPGLLFLSFHY